MAAKLCTWFLSQGMMSGLNSSSKHSNVHFFSPSYRLLPASCKMRHRNLRVDLCHQANDEDDEDEDSSSQEALLDKTSSYCTSFCCNVGMCCNNLDWMGKNPVDSAVVTRVSGLAVVSVLCFTSSSFVAHLTDIQVGENDEGTISMFASFTSIFSSFHMIINTLSFYIMDHEGITTTKSSKRTRSKYNNIHH